jgi:hypothetical protein
MTNLNRLLQLLFALALTFVAVTLVPPALATTTGGFFDTTCREVPYTPEGLARLEPIKAANLGTFNCSGSFTYFDPSTGHVTATIDVPWFNQSTLYEPSCGCWVTTSFAFGPTLPPLVIYEYGNALPGRAEEGTCLEFAWPEDDGNITQSIAFGRNMHFNVHRDLPYLRQSDGTLTRHQSFYRVAGTQNELVVVRKFNEAGYIDWIENLVCLMVEPQLL